MTDEEFDLRFAELQQIVARHGVRKPEQVPAPASSPEPATPATVSQPAAKSARSKPAKAETPAKATSTTKAAAPARAARSAKPIKGSQPSPTMDVVSTAQVEVIPPSTPKVGPSRQKAATRPKGSLKTPGSGRKAGTPNRITVDLRQAILEAFQLEGGVTYLREVAQTDMRTFCALLSKVLPTTLASDPVNPVVLTVSDFLRSIDGQARQIR